MKGNARFFVQIVFCYIVKKMFVPFKYRVVWFVFYAPFLIFGIKEVTFSILPKEVKLGFISLISPTYS